MSSKQVNENVKKYDSIFLVVDFYYFLFQDQYLYNKYINSMKFYYILFFSFGKNRENLRLDLTSPRAKPGCVPLH